MAKILLVDDDDSLRNMLRISLAQMGHDVVEARNGREALTLFAQDPADVVLTDIVMPDKEGIEIIGELRRKHAKLKIIAMSGGGHVSASAYLRIATSIGADHVLAKPFSISELKAVIDILIRPCRHGYGRGVTS